MAETRPPTLWATASLACGAAGCLGAVLWLASIARPPVETTGVSAGIALALVGLPSFALCSCAVVCGVVARCGGARARAGVLLGWLPFAAFFAGAVFGGWRMPW